jgi:hypothetical protein
MAAPARARACAVGRVVQTLQAVQTRGALAAVTARRSAAYRGAGAAFA